MRRVDRLRRPQQCRECLDLGGRRVERRSISEPARHADGAGIERLLQPLAHLRQLGFVGRPVERAHRPDPQGRVADEAGGVECSRRPVDSREIVGETLVTVIGAVAEQIEGRRRRPVHHQWRQADPAIPGDHGRDPLTRLRRHRRGGKKGAVVMGVHVDEAGCDDPARYVDLAGTRHPLNITHRGDAVARDRHVCASARPAAAVDHIAAAQNPVVHFRPFNGSAPFNGAASGSIPAVCPRTAFVSRRRHRQRHRASGRRSSCLGARIHRPAACCSD